MVTLNQQIPRTEDNSIHLEAWIQSRFGHFPSQKQALIRHACQLSRLSGETLANPFGASCFEESLKMADILLSLALDIDTIAAALICNSAQYGDLSSEDILEHLGPNVSALANGYLKMTVLNAANSSTPNAQQTNNIRKMILAMVADVRVVLIKLAERICLMRHIKFLKTSAAQKLAQETHDIYAPLANRLGISQMKWELEDLSFFYLQNAAYKQIASGLNEKRIARDERIQLAKSMIQEMLDTLNIDASVSGRSKHIYSIHQKMQRKKVSLEEIYDASALRVIVNTVEDCYSILAQIHAQWAHIPEEFDDYVSNPKPNGYQSIHTVIIGPNDKNIEIQIRTHQMHEDAEMGFAAHWVYKEGAHRESSSYEEKISRLRELLAWHKEIAQDNANPTEEFHDPVFEDRVYVFTPNGDIVDLPKGATPLDFAYRIHSNIGHRCRGAKINQRIVPLNYALNTGETVHVLTSKSGTPSRDWLNPQAAYVVTARARAKIQHWFNLQDHDHHVTVGESLLTKEITRLGLRDVNQKKLAERLHYQTTEDMLAALGKGSLRVGQLVNALSEHKAPSKPDIVSNPSQRLQKPSAIEIEGVGNLLTYFANCCKPVHGDAIIGYITQGRGIAIHRNNCPNIVNVERKNPDRLIDVNWGGQNTRSFKADLHIGAEDRSNLLRDITQLFSTEKINLINLNTAVKNTEAELRLTVEVDDLSQLSLLLEKLLQIKGVHTANRIG